MNSGFDYGQSMTRITDHSKSAISGWSADPRLGCTRAKFLAMGPWVAGKGPRGILRNLRKGFVPEYNSREENFVR